MQGKTGFYKTKGQNNWNNKFCTTGQTGQSDKEKQKHLLNKKRQSNWHYNKEQNNWNNKSYTTNQFYENHGYYEKRNNLKIFEQKILTMTKRQDLTEKEIFDALNDIQKYASSDDYNNLRLSLMLENLAKQKKLNDKQINRILLIAEKVTIRARSYVIQVLIKCQILQNNHISEILYMVKMDKGISQTIGPLSYVIQALIEYQTLQDDHIYDVLGIIKSTEEFKTKYCLLLNLIDKQKKRLADNHISEILDMINDWDIGYQIYVLEKLCQVQTLSQARIDKMFEIMSKFQPNQQVNLIRYSSKKQELSDQQIDGLLESNTLLYLAINYPSSLFVILKCLVEAQNLSAKQIDTIVFLISQLKLNQQGYILYSLIMHNGQQLTNEHIKKILDIVSNLEINQIVKIIKEVKKQQLPLFVLNTLLLLTSLDNNKDKDLAEEPVSKIKNQKINLEEQRHSLLSLLITLKNVSKEQVKNIVTQIYNTVLKIITMISSSKQQAFILAALIRWEEGNMPERYIDEILNEIGNFNLQELCCLLNFLISEQKLSAKHMDIIVNMIARGIGKLDKIQERIYVLDTLIDKNQKLLMSKSGNKILDENQNLLTGKHIDKILEVTPKLIQEQQIDVLDNLGKSGQLNPGHISKILKIMKSYKGGKKERLMLEYFIKGKQLNQGHVSTVIEIIELYIKQNPNSEKCIFMLECLLEQKQLELTKEQVDKIISIITSLKSKEQSPVLQALIKYGKQQKDQSLVDNIFGMVKNLESREQSFVLECFAKEKLLTETRIDETLSMMKNWTSREKRHVLVALIQSEKEQMYEKKQMNKSRISAVFKIIKDLDPSDKSLVLECLTQEILLTEAQINEILGILQKQQSKNIKLTDEQCMFVVTALIQRQSLGKDQILKISRIIAAFGIKVKRRLLSCGLSGYLIKDPWVKFKYKQIYKILVETLRFDTELNNPKQARNQIKQCRVALFYHFFSEVKKKAIKKIVFRILKKYMPMAEDKHVNEISPEGKKVETSLKISAEIGSKNNSIFNQFKGNNKKSILGAMAAVKNHQENFPMLRTSNNIYDHDNI